MGIMSYSNIMSWQTIGTSYTLINSFTYGNIKYSQAQWGAVNVAEPFVLKKTVCALRVWENFRQ